MKGFKKITIWGQDRYISYKYIVAEVTSTYNFYEARNGFDDKRQAIRWANTYSKIYDMELVVIQMR